MAFLAPDIVQAIVDGTHPPHLNATTVLWRMDLPLDWDAQRKLLGLR